MPKLTDTYARAYAACGEILGGLGRFPTIELIRDRIGVNSPATIKRAINDWTAAMAVESRERLFRPGVPETLLDAATQVWRLAQDEAAGHLAEERAALAAERQAFEREMAALREAHAAQQRDGAAEREALERERARLQAQVTEQAVALADTQASLGQLRQEAAAAREALAEAKGRLAEAQATQVRLQAEWEVRAEQENRWHLRRIEEEKTRAQQAARDALAQKDAALVKAQQQRDALQARLNEAARATAEMSGENRLLREDRDRWAQQHAILLQELQALRTSPPARPQKTGQRRRPASDPVAATPPGPKSRTPGRRKQAPRKPPSPED